MKKITCVYTGMGSLPSTVEKTFREAVGEAKFHHILDSGLIFDIVEAGGVTPELEERIFHLFDAAATTGADVIVSTCSSIGETTQKYAAEHPEVRMLRVDLPMAEHAAKNGRKVAVLATLATTVEPSANLVEEQAAALGRDVEIIRATVPGAFDALMGGNADLATELVVKTAKETCMDADIILLAQASMAMFKPALRDALGDGAVLLESPSTCAQYLKENL